MFLLLVGFNGLYRCMSYPSSGSPIGGSTRISRTKFRFRDVIHEIAIGYFGFRYFGFEKLCSGLRLIDGSLLTRGMLVGEHFVLWFGWLEMIRFAAPGDQDLTVSKIC